MMLNSWLSAWVLAMQIQQCWSFVPQAVDGISKLAWRQPQQRPLFTQDATIANARPLGSTSTALGMARAPQIDDWKVLTNGRVVGRVKFHPSIPDGEVITTSPLAKPELAGKGKTVTTGSGSKYSLGKPAVRATKPQSSSSKGDSSAAAEPEQVNGDSGVVSLQELQRRAKVELDLTGEVIGDDARQYLLAGRPTKSTSGKSRIYKAYLANSDGLPEGEPLTAKLTANWEALEREASNYNRITKAGVTRGQFVFLMDYLPTASIITKKFAKESALVIERGTVDLKKYISINGRLEGKELRDAAAAAAQCLQAVHDSGLVWTDLKTENFVVTKEGQVKGIDLESAMPVRDNPVDYSPEATPPEFAKAFLEGEGPYFILEPNYDIWSFGMLLYELSTGAGYWDGKTPVQITKALREKPEIDLSNADIDPKFKDLIKQCLDLNPRNRPSIVKVLLHPYFLSTGIGPFSLFA